VTTNAKIAPSRSRYGRLAGFFTPLHTISSFASIRAIERMMGGRQPAFYAAQQSLRSSELIKNSSLVKT
jgi:hypothetical protein